MPGSNVRSQLARGVSWTLLGSILSKLLGAVLGVALARVLGAERFGQYAIVVSTIGMFSVYGGFRLANTCIKYVSEFQESDPVRAARVLKLTLLASAILCALTAGTVALLAGPLAGGALGDQGLQTALLAGALLLFFQAYESIVTQSLAGFQDFRSLAAVGVLRSVCSLAIALPLAFYGGVAGAVAAGAVVSIVLLPIAFALVRRNAARARLPGRIPWREALIERRLLWSYALPGFITLVALTASNWLSRLVLTRTPDGFVDLGLLEAAAQWGNIILFLPTMFSGVLLPILSAAQRDKSRSAYEEAFRLQMKSLLLATLPVTMAVLTAAGPITSLYGRDFAGSAPILQMLAVATFFRTFNDGLRVLAESQGQQWTTSVFYLGWSGVLLLSTLLLVPSGGALGLAGAMLVAETALFVMLYIRTNTCLLPGAARPHLAHFAACLACLLADSLAVLILRDGPLLFIQLLLTCTAVVPVLMLIRRRALSTPAVSSSARIAA